MTNLFLNGNRAIAMDNRQQINPGLNKVNKIEILGKIKPIFFQHFEPAVEDFCMRIDLEFGRQLGKNREKMAKEHYIKLLEYLRLIRGDIKQNYLSKVNDIFDGNQQNTEDGERGPLDFSKISLIGDDAVKENYAITLIIRQCEHLFYEELVGINRLLAFQQGQQTIADGHNPMVPEKLVRALVEVVKPLKLNTGARITLYKAFEANVFSQLGFIYSELMTRCETVTPARMKVEQYRDQCGSVPNPVPLYAVDEIREAVEPIPAKIEQPSVAFRLLQKKLELWRLAHFPSAYDLISATGNAFYEQFEIKNALQVMQQVNDDTYPGEKKQALKRRVLRKLEELSFSVDVRILARHDEDMLDLAALIFNEIEQDKLLEDAVKAAILRLEIPLAAASLGQYSIFTSQDNPIRRLLDDLFDAGMFLNADEDDDRLIQARIVNAVSKMTLDSGFELSAWVTESGEFSDYLNKKKQRSQNIEQNARQLMISKQALASSRKIILTTIENSVKGNKLPTAIVEFLRGVWADVLLDAYTHKDERPEQWEKSVRAMDDLIVSVIAPADDNERKQILKLLPGLIAELRRGLKQISYDKSAQSRFFKDLAVWHIILMDKKEAKKTLDDSDKAAALSVEGEQIKTEAITNPSSEQADILTEGNWVAFTSEAGLQWGKLLWKNAENMLFVGKNGAKIVEIQVAELAEKLRLGQAALVKASEEKITERALLKLMSL